MRLMVECKTQAGPVAARRASAARQRGAIMVITLLAVVLLAALVFYVINLGRQANARIVAQNAADATAAAGAGWIARTFNTVAMNNTGMARLIVTVNVLDAMPMAIAHTHVDQIAMEDGLHRQLQRGVSDWYVREPLQQMREEILQEIDILAPLDRFFNDSGYDVREMTFYDGPRGMGHIWRAMHAMDEFSQAGLENLGVLAQVNAIHGGQINLRRDVDTPDEQSTAVLVPFVPDVPWRRGRFDDFEQPVRRGLLPPDLDDMETNRGPWDVLYGWRRPGRVTEREGGPDRPPGDINTPPISTPPDFGPAGRARGWESYHTYGPQRWVLDRVGGFARSHLFHSRFARSTLASSPRWWVNDLANIKLGYVWPGTGSRNVVEPEWQHDWDQAVALSQTEESRIRTTAFARVEVKSRFPHNATGWLSGGSWAYTDSEHPGRVLFRNGWFNPDVRLTSATKVQPHIWRIEWQYPTYSDPEIGLPPVFDEDGNRQPQTVYRVDHIAFLGIDVGQDVPVRNPFNFSSRGDLPAPCDFDPAVIRPDDHSRREHLTYLSAVTRTNRSLFWPSHFDAGRPSPYTVSIAQAAVFNNHSWDLWTQMWHVRLERVEDYNDWIARLEATAPDAAMVPLLDPGRIEALHAYLRSVEPLAEVMLTH